MFMSEKMKEELSAMMDDESSMFGIRRVLAEMSNDKEGELDNCWQRYHFVRAALQQSGVCHTSLSERVRATLENESEVTTDTFAATPQPFAFMRKAKLGQHLGSMAVAASVAFVTVFTWQQFQGLQHDNNNRLKSPAAVVARAEVPKPSVATTTLATTAMQDQKPLLDASDALILSDLPRSGIQTASAGNQSRPQQNLIPLPVSNIDILALKKLDLFMFNHAEHAALNTSRGMLPLARTINYTTVNGDQ